MSDTLPEDIMDSLTYGSVSKEDIIRYLRQDDLFKDFELVNINDDIFNDDIEFDELEKGEKFSGYYIFEKHYGLDISIKNVIDDIQGEVCMYWELSCNTEFAKLITETYPYEVTTDIIHESLILHNEKYNLSYRKQAKQIIEEKWIDFCQSCLHKQIIYGHAYMANIDKIHEFYEVARLKHNMPGYSHHEIRKWHKDYLTRVYQSYPYLLNLQNL